MSLKIFRLGLYSVIAIALLFTFLELAVVLRFNSAAAKAHVACSSNQDKACIEALISASRWSSPLSNTAENQAQLVLTLLSANSELNKLEKAELLWQLRRAAYSSRSLLRPEVLWGKSALLTQIDQMLGLEAKGKQLIDPGKEPTYWLQLLAQLFFWNWILFALITIWKGFNTRLQVNSKFIGLAGISLLWFFAWLVALLNA